VEFADIRMVVDPRDNYTETCLWLNEYPPEIKSLVALVELVEDRNMLVFDIGANCGAYSIPLAMAAGDGSRVVAFEPNPLMIGRLGMNIALNNLTDRVRIEGCALSDREGEAMLNFRGHNYGQASLLPIEGKQQNGGVLVPTRPLSAFTHAARHHDGTILKIDVEGAEEVVLNPILTPGTAEPCAPREMRFTSERRKRQNCNELGNCPTDQEKRYGSTHAPQELPDDDR